jgi:hypothetical protein
MGPLHEVRNIMLKQDVHASTRLTCGKVHTEVPFCTTDINKERQGWVGEALCELR